jgi:hypothetical protein
MTTIEALKNLAVALGCAKKVDAVKGNTVAEVIQFMADNCKKSSK